MTPDEIIKILAVQSPAIALLLYWSNRLYTDWQKERAERKTWDERQIVALEKIAERLDNIENTVDIG